MASPTWGVLWDVDGTLVDTAELHYQAWGGSRHGDRQDL